jgi:hypothetical protein
MEDNTEVLDNNEKTTETTEQKKKSPDQGVPSKRQLEHLEYARAMKKLKQQSRNHEAEVQSKHLDFIYKRLSNMEKTLTTLAEEGVPVARGSKRRKPKSSKSEESDESSKNKKKSRKINKNSEDEDRRPPTLYETYSPYAYKAIFVGTGAFILSLVKQYATNYDTRTNDGDHVNGYYLPQDN